MKPPIKFATHYRHNKLYHQYDTNPTLWKACMYNYILNRNAGFNLNEDPKKIAREIEFSDYPWEHESCDYWLFQPRTKAMRYAKHSACQFLSFANYFYLLDAFPGKKFFHISDYDMNHFYCMDENGEVFDPQGLALLFDINDYKKTFNEDSVTDTDQIHYTIEDFVCDYHSKHNGYYQYQPDTAPEPSLTPCNR